MTAGVKDIFMMKLIDAEVGKGLIFVKAVGGKEILRRLAEIGLCPGEKIKIVDNSGMGPLTIKVKGGKLALGMGLAEKILVKEDKSKMNIKDQIIVAFAGNPNSGKSTIFNNLTGSRQHVGNYPGVTVEKKEGTLISEEYELTFVDLPGTYSLSGYSEDEIVAQNFIINDRPDIIVHIVDASNLERNLYLYTQISMQDIPVILAMNMSDVARERGYNIDYDELSILLGVKIVETVGNKKKGMDELTEAIIKTYENKIDIEKVRVTYGEEIEAERSIICGMLDRYKDDIAPYTVEWMCIKLLEQDAAMTRIVEKLPDGRDVLEQVDRSTAHLKKHFGEEIYILVADRRYGFISGACTQAVTYSVEERHDFSDNIDRIILNRFFGIPIFAIVMYIIFKFTFTFSAPVRELFDKFFVLLSNLAAHVIPVGLFQSFVIDGIIGGVGGVLGFLPLVLFMFFAIAFFEDCGYMARGAFIMDKIMNKFGLHGKSFLPMMISTNGCAVPGIMATRTLDNKKERLITMMVTPFMICGAKLPIFALFIGVFFSEKYGANIMFLMYALSVVIAFGSAWALKKFVFRGEASHFVMELPPYRMPTFKGLLLKMWERGWLYIKKAGTIIVLLSIIIWAGFVFPKYTPVQDQDESVGKVKAMQLEYSFAGRLGKFIEPVLRPIGIDSRGGIALIAGVAAKEAVVSTLGTIYSFDETDPDNPKSLKEALENDKAWNPLKGLVFLIFCLIYIPCIASMVVFYRESGSSVKWTFFLVLWTTMFAWIVSFLVYQTGIFLGFG